MQAIVCRSPVEIEYARLEAERERLVRATGGFRPSVYTTSDCIRQHRANTTRINDIDARLLALLA